MRIWNWESKVMMKSVLLTWFIITVPLWAENSDAEYLRLIHEYDVKENGEFSYRHTHRLRLNSYFAVNRLFGETFVVFDTTFQTLTVHKSITTMRDGKKIPSPDNAFNLVLPRMASKAPAFNRLREMVITHTGLEVGSIIDLDYTLQTKPGFVAGFSKAVELRQNVPVDTLTIRVRIPRNKYFNYACTEGDITPDSIVFDTHKIYEWNFLDLPPATNEPLHHKPVPSLYFSTCDDYQSVLGDLFNEAGTLNEEIHTFFKKETDSLESKLEQILAVQEILATQVYTYSVPFHQAGYRFRGPAEVWQAAAGTAEEKARLFQAIINGLGIPSDIVLAAQIPSMKPDIVVPELFTDVMVRVDLPGSERRYFNTDKLMDKPLISELIGKTLLVKKNGTLVTSTQYIEEDFKSLSDWKANVTLTEEKTEGKLTGTLRGIFHPYYKLLKNEDHFKNFIIQSSQHMTVTETTLEKLEQSGLKASVLFEQLYKDTSEAQFLFPLPLPSDVMGLIYNKPITLTRESELNLPVPLSEHLEWTIKTPVSWTLLSGDVKIEKENSIGKITISFTGSENEIRIVRKLDIHKMNISPEQYDAFLELWRLWNAPKYRELVFMK